MHQLTICSASQVVEAAMVVHACYRGIRNHARGVHRHRQRQPLPRAMPRAPRGNPSTGPATQPAPGPPRGRLAPPRKRRGRECSNQRRVRDKRVLPQSESLILDSNLGNLNLNPTYLGNDSIAQVLCIKDMQKPAEMTAS